MPSFHLLCNISKQVPMHLLLVLKKAAAADGEWIMTEFPFLGELLLALACKFCLK